MLIFMIAYLALFLFLFFKTCVSLISGMSYYIIHITIDDNARYRVIVESIFISTESIRDSLHLRYPHCNDGQTRYGFIRADTY